MSQVDMKEAVRAAFESFHTLYDGTGVTDPLLEEIERSEDGKSWLVTIGFNATETEPPSALDEAIARAKGLAPPGERKKLWRKYKLFQIDSESGQLTSMKAKES
jgi:hypothetical protein